MSSWYDAPDDNYIPDDAPDPWDFDYSEEEYRADEELAADLADTQEMTAIEIEELNERDRRRVVPDLQIDAMLSVLYTLAVEEGHNAAAPALELLVAHPPAPSIDEWLWSLRSSSPAAPALSLLAQVVFEQHPDYRCCEVVGMQVLAQMRSDALQAAPNRKRQIDKLFLRPILALLIKIDWCEWDDHLAHAAIEADEVAAWGNDRGASYHFVVRGLSQSDFLSL